MLVRGAVPLALSQELWDHKRGRQWAGHTPACFFRSQIPFEELLCLVESQMRRWVGLGSTQGLLQKQGLEQELEQSSSSAVPLCILQGTSLGSLTTED